MSLERLTVIEARFRFCCRFCAFFWIVIPRLKNTCIMERLLKKVTSRASGVNETMNYSKKQTIRDLCGKNQNINYETLIKGDKVARDTETKAEIRQKIADDKPLDVSGKTGDTDKRKAATSKT